MVERMEVAAGVASVYAPPAMVFLHPLHFQIPTWVRLMASRPQKAQVYYCTHT